MCVCACACMCALLIINNSMLMILFMSPLGGLWEALQRKYIHILTDRHKQIYCKQISCSTEAERAALWCASWQFTGNWTGLTGESKKAGSWHGPPMALASQRSACQVPIKEPSQSLFSCLWGTLQSGSLCLWRCQLQLLVKHEKTRPWPFLLEAHRCFIEGSHDSPHPYIKFSYA